MRLIEEKCLKCKKIYLLNVDDPAEFCPYCGKKLNLDLNELNKKIQKIYTEDPVASNEKIIYKVISIENKENTIEDKASVVIMMIFFGGIIAFGLFIFKKFFQF